MAVPVFDSFFMGGFESSTMKFHDGRRVHVARTTRHIERADEDYALACGSDWHSRSVDTTLAQALRRAQASMGVLPLLAIPA